MNVFASKQGRDFTPSFTLSRVMHLWKKGKGIVLRGITGIFQQALIDWTTIIFGTISHYEHNFHLQYLLKQPKSACNLCQRANYALLFLHYKNCHLLNLQSIFLVCDQNYRQIKVPQSFFCLLIVTVMGLGSNRK